MAWQEAFAAKVEAATRAREEAKARLTEAKRLVEPVITTRRLSIDSMHFLSSWFVRC